MEGKGEQIVLPDCHGIALQACKDVHFGSTRCDNGRSYEHSLDQIVCLPGKLPDMKASCKAFLLAAKGIAQDCNIHEPKTWLFGKAGQISGQKYHAGARGKHRYARSAQLGKGVKKAFFQKEFAHDSALAARKDNAPQTLEIGRASW